MPIIKDGIRRGMREIASRDLDKLSLEAMGLYLTLLCMNQDYGEVDIGTMRNGIADNPYIIDKALEELKSHGLVTACYHAKVKCDFYTAHLRSETSNNESKS